MLQFRIHVFLGKNLIFPYFFLGGGQFGVGGAVTFQGGAAAPPLLIAMLIKLSAWQDLISGPTSSSACGGPGP